MHRVERACACHGIVSPVCCVQHPQQHLSTKGDAGRTNLGQIFVETEEKAERDIVGQIPIPAFFKPSAQIIDQQIHKWVS